MAGRLGPDWGPTSLSLNWGRYRAPLLDSVAPVPSVLGLPYLPGSSPGWPWAPCALALKGVARRKAWALEVMKIIAQEMHCLVTQSSRILSPLTSWMPPDFLTGLEFPI